MTVDHTLPPAAVIQLLEQQTDDRRPVVNELRRDAPIRVLRQALRDTQPQSLARHLLCDLLGFRAARSALPELLDALDDPSRSTRASAADATSKALGYGGVHPPPSWLARRVMPVLLRHWHMEPTPQVRSLLTQALGLSGDRSVQPLLEETLDDPYRQVRDGAEWALDRLLGPSNH